MLDLPVSYFLGLPTFLGRSSWHNLPDKADDACRLQVVFKVVILPVAFFL